MADFNLNLGNIENVIVAKATQAVNYALQEMKREIDDRTPVKTGRLKENTKIEPASMK